MQRLGVLLVLVLVLMAGLPAASSGQGRPRRVDPSQTVPPPTDGRVPVQSGAPGSEQDDTLSLEGDLIEVPAVVSDRSGHYVPQLRKEDFRVLEDGVEQEISFFSSERVPIHVAIVMDTSGSARDTIYDIQSAAIEFLNQLLPGDKVLVVSFNSQVIVEQEFTNDRRQLTQAIRRTQANGSTKLYEAVYLTVAERLRHVEGRKAMVILSDGEDTASKDVSADEAVNACSESDVVVYGIRYPESEGTNVFRIPQTTPPTFPGQGPNTGPNTNPGGTYPPGYPQPRRRNRQRPNVNIPNIPWPSWPLQPTGSGFVASPQYSGRNPGQRQGNPNSGWGWGTGTGGDPFMDAVTSNSGGALYYAESIGNVAGVFAAIAEELRQTYIIGYSPTNPVSKGGYRRITVQVPARSEVAVRHRLGYQAEAYK